MSVADESTPPDPRFDLVGLGESMLTLFQERGSTDFSSDVAGAESNVVRNCAALGLRTDDEWASL